MNFKKKELKLSEDDLERINLCLGNYGSGLKGLGKTITDLTPLRMLTEVYGQCNKKHYENFLEGIVNKNQIKESVENFTQDPYYFSKEKVNILEYKN